MRELESFIKGIGGIISAGIFIILLVIIFQEIANQSQQILGISTIFGLSILILFFFLVIKIFDLFKKMF